MSLRLRSDHELAQENMPEAEHQLSLLEKYKILTIAANNGHEDPKESELPSTLTILLHCRRLLYTGRFTKVASLLASLEYDEALLKGERLFILAMAKYRLGHDAEAIAFMAEAAGYLHSAGEEHRCLRAKINLAIFRQTLESFRSGELFFLAQAAKRSMAYDLCGNIYKSKAIELIKHGFFSESITSCHLAREAYSLAGCPVDLSLTFGLLAIASWIIGDFEHSKEAENQVDVKHGKVESYLEILALLKQGMVPVLPANHPLAGSPFPTGKDKAKSVSARIIQLLKARAHTRAELIEAVWGTQADYESLSNRLYVAIARIRKERNILIQFDGEKYRL